MRVANRSIVKLFGLLILTLLLLFSYSVAYAESEKSDSNNSGKKEEQQKQEEQRKKEKEKQKEIEEKQKELELLKIKKIEGDNVLLENKKEKDKDIWIKKKELEEKRRGGPLKKDDLFAIISSESGKFASVEGKLKHAVKVFRKEASDTARQSKKRSIHGIVTAVNGTTIQIAHQSHSDRTAIINTNAFTMFKEKSNKDLTIASITPGRKIVAIGEPQANNSILAKKIMIIPARQPKASGSAVPVISPSASASAQPSESPSPEPSASPSEIEL